MTSPDLPPLRERLRLLALIAIIGAFFFAAAYFVPCWISPSSEICGSTRQAVCRVLSVYVLLVPTLAVVAALSFLLRKLANRAAKRKPQEEADLRVMGGFIGIAFIGVGVVLALLFFLRSR
jgi:H+/Cl- antiporter ClcA